MMKLNFNELIQLYVNLQLIKQIIERETEGEETYYQDSLDYKDFINPEDEDFVELPEDDPIFTLDSFHEDQEFPDVDIPMERSKDEEAYYQDSLDYNDFINPEDEDFVELPEDDPIYIPDSFHGDQAFPDVDIPMEPPSVEDPREKNNREHRERRHRNRRMDELWQALPDMVFGERKNYEPAASQLLMSEDFEEGGNLALKNEASVPFIVDKISLRVNYSFVDREKARPFFRKGPITLEHRGAWYIIHIHAELISLYVKLYLLLVYVFRHLGEKGVLNVPNRMNIKQFINNHTHFAGYELAFDISTNKLKEAIDPSPLRRIGRYTTWYSQDNRLKRRTDGSIKERQDSLLCLYDRGKKLGKDSFFRIEIRLYGKYNKGRFRFPLEKQRSKTVGAVVMADLPRVGLALRSAVKEQLLRKDSPALPVALRMLLKTLQL